MKRFLLSAADQSSLLGELCMELGFCSLSTDARKLLATTPLSMDEYTETVIGGECGDSYAGEHPCKTRAQIRQRVGWYYDRATNHGLWHLQFPNDVVPRSS